MSGRKEGASFFQNRACPYFPCHEGLPLEDFNCMMCYCPLYLLGDGCGGDFVYLEDGIKSCVSCTRPHDPDRWDEMMKMCGKVVSLARKDRRQDSGTPAPSSPASASAPHRERRL